MAKHPDDLLDDLLAETGQAWQVSADPPLPPSWWYAMPAVLPPRNSILQSVTY